MKQVGKQPLAISVGKPGDGVPMGVTRRTQLNPDGTTLSLFDIDVSQAPVPDRRYMADTAWVDREEDLIRLMFGQRRIDKKGLRSLVVLCLTPEGLGQFLDACSGFPDALKTLLDQKRGQLSTADEEPLQTVSMFVNIIAAAVAGDQAAMDCYHASPWAFRDLKSSGARNFPIEPIVRIVLTTSLFAALFQELLRIRQGLPAPAAAGAHLGAHHG